MSGNKVAEIMDLAVARAAKDRPPKSSAPAAEPPELVWDDALDKLIIPPAVFVVDEVVPEGVTILSAPPKLGKSWFDQTVAIAVAAGAGVLWGRKCKNGRVLYLDLEGNRRRSQTRSRAIRASKPAVPGLAYAYAWPGMDNGGLELLEAHIVEHGFVLAIVDIWALFRSRLPKNGDAYQHDLDTIARLKAVYTRTSCSFLLTHHNRKQTDSDFLNEVAGTIGFTGGADGVLVMSRERGSAEAKLKVTGKDLLEAEFAMTCSGGVWTVLGDAAEYRQSKERNAIYEVVRRAGKPVTAKQVTDELYGEQKLPNVTKLLHKMWKAGSLDNTNGLFSVRECS